MPWSAPPTQHLLESRLQSARLELFNDPRLSEARENGAAPEFSTKLIEEKLAAAASTGLDAVEASLRLSASEVLGSKQVNPDAARETLRRAGEALKSAQASRSAQMPWSPSPVHMACGLFIAWALIAAGAGAAAGFPWWGNLLLVLMGAVPARLAQVVYADKRAKLRRKQVNELPARVCRQYIRHHDDGVGRYEDAVRNLLGESDRPSS